MLTAISEKEAENEEIEEAPHHHPHHPNVSPLTNNAVLTASTADEEKYDPLIDYVSSQSQHLL